MKHKNSKIGEYGIKWEPVEGYSTKDGKKVPPHLKKIEFKWKHYTYQNPILFYSYLIKKIDL